MPDGYAFAIWFLKAFLGVALGIVVGGGGSCGGGLAAVSWASSGWKLGGDGNPGIISAWRLENRWSVKNAETWAS